MSDYFEKIQVPKAILSDNGTQFCARIWVDTLSKFNVKVKHTSVYFPQGNMTERINREIGRLLRYFCFKKHTRWAYVINDV